MLFPQGILPFLETIDLITVFLFSGFLKPWPNLPIHRSNLDVKILMIIPYVLINV